MGDPQTWLDHAPNPVPLRGDQRWHVFLSYRSVHRPWVIQLYDVLRHLGYEVFLDQYVLRASDVLTRSLEQGLTQSASGVLIWSTATEDSDWCRKEYDAMELRRTQETFPYVVVKLDSVKLPLFAAQRIYIDFSEEREGPRGTGLLRLLYGLQDKPLPDAAVRLAADVDDDVRRSLAAIKAAIITGDHERLLELSKTQSPAWLTSALLGCEVARGLINLKRYDDALVILDALIARCPRSIRPIQLKGLALARKGEWKAAQRLLSVLEAAGEQDPETLGIYARTWMDDYNATGDQLSLAKSRDIYAQAFGNAPKDYYTGINAAAKSVFLGELDAARGFADRVEQVVGTVPKPGDYWTTATVAEVQLIKQNYDTAADLYKAAVVMSPKELGSHESTWGQARLLLDKLGAPKESREKVAKAFAHLAKPKTGEAAV
jgi:tetratricopeptide (TPR) repeat protein